MYLHLQYSALQHDWPTAQQRCGLSGQEEK